MAPSAAQNARVTTCQLDPTHSSVEFSVKHMMMTTVRGRFKNISATLRGGPDHPDDAGVDARLGFRRLALGSVAGAGIRHSRVPVLVLPLPKD